MNADQAPRQVELHTYVPDVRLSSRIMDAVIPPGSSLVGRSLLEVGLPRGVLVVQIQREDTPIVPSGGTVFQAGDHVLVLATPDALPALEALAEQAGLILASGLTAGRQLDLASTSAQT